jgi:hypothetical protein
MRGFPAILAACTAVRARLLVASVANGVPAEYGGRFDAC